MKFFLRAAREAGSSAMVSAGGPLSPNPERSLSMKRFPWLQMRKKTDPELPYEPPFWFGNQSNGEYFHHATARQRKIRKLILEKADENARRIGMPRRDFLASAMGM